jgi:hypothetical protein
LINPIRNLCSRNDELKRYLHLEGIALHALGDAGVDAGSLPLDTPLSALGEFSGVQGHARWAAEASGSAEPTIRDLAFVLEGANRVVGTADEIACYLEEWREAGVNGINIYHASTGRAARCWSSARKTSTRSTAYSAGSGSAKRRTFGLPCWP